MSSFWKTIWDKKGNSDSEDLLYLDGYEHLDVDFHSSDICEKIIETVGAKPGQTVLEVGCGAGYLSREFVSEKFKYFGVDYSQPLIDKHKKMFPSHKVSCAEACKLPFDSHCFDHVFLYGVFQYFPSMSYAFNVISEMQRVSNKSVFLGDLKETATREQHLPCEKKNIINLGFHIVDSFHDSDDCYRYNAYMKVGDVV